MFELSGVDFSLYIYKIDDVQLIQHLVYGK